MPYELTWEEHGVYRRYFGNVTIEERARSFEEIVRDPRFGGLRYTITDYLGAESYEITDQATEEIAARHAGPLQNNPNIIIAAAVVDRNIVGAIEHFMAVKTFSQPYRMFSSVGAAREWISSI
jgi:hypothetical protein